MGARRCHKGCVGGKTVILPKNGKKDQGDMRRGGAPSDCRAPSAPIPRSVRPNPTGDEHRPHGRSVGSFDSKRKRRESVKPRIDVRENEPFEV